MLASHAGQASIEPDRVRWDLTKLHITDPMRSILVHQGLASSPLTARTRPLWTRHLDLKPLTRALNQGDNRLHSADGSLISHKEIQQGTSILPALQCTNPEHSLAEQA